MEHMRRRVFLTALFAEFSSTLRAGDKHREMKACTAELPNHVLDFSIPEEMAREMSPRQVNSYFDPSRPFERGFQIVSRTMYDFKGPFWIGALGSLSFHVFVQERAAEYKGGISTAEGLEKYIYWWVPLVRNSAVIKLVESL